MARIVDSREHSSVTPRFYPSTYQDTWARLVRVSRSLSASAETAANRPASPGFCLLSPDRRVPRDTL